MRLYTSQISSTFHEIMYTLINQYVCTNNTTISYFSLFYKPMLISLYAKVYNIVQPYQTHIFYKKTWQLTVHLWPLGINGHTNVIHVYLFTMFLKRERPEKDVF